MNEPRQTCPPGNWQRPIMTIMGDLDRYEALILAADAHFRAPKMASNIASRVIDEAQRIRAKQQKEGPPEATETQQEKLPAENLQLT